MNSPRKDRLPEWLRTESPLATGVSRMQAALDRRGLHSICEEASCPNRGECFPQGIATFLILGSTCTRGCRFCGVSKGRVEPPDPEEPERLAQAVRRMKLRHVVVTSVCRDDLPDGGAGAFAAAVAALQALAPAPTVEVLIPDFKGDPAALGLVLAARPQVLGHNVETVPRLYPEVRSQAEYRRSLEVLRRAADSAAPRPLIKSGLMAGLGETREELIQTMRDLRAAGCELLTLGQYLPPSRQAFPVTRYLTPAEFDKLGNLAYELGFTAVKSAPLARSSYLAHELLR